MFDEARKPPRLAIGIEAPRLREMAAALPRIVPAGVDGAIVAAPGDEANAPWLGDLEPARTAFGAEAVLLHGAIALARRARVGVLLPERGIATAEARRLLGAGLPVGRLVGSAEAAAAARGADLLVVERAVAHDLARVRRIAAAGWEPALVWCEPEPEAARAALAAGCEGIVVPWDLLDRQAPEAALAAVAAVLPAVAPPVADAIAITFDGEALTIEPETTIADLLADAGLPEDIVVRVNGVRLARRRYDDTMARPGDAIDTGPAPGGNARQS